MAATRNRNTRGNYALEKMANHQWLRHTISRSDQSIPNAALPGMGFVGGPRFYKEQEGVLSNNGIDIESALWGLGSANMERIEETMQYPLLTVQPVYPSMVHIAPEPSTTYLCPQQQAQQPFLSVTNPGQRPFLWNL